MNITKEEFRFDSRDGKTQLYATSWAPDTEPLAVVQIIHGMNEYIDRYDRFARFLAEQGFYVTGEDHLGHGKSVPEGGTFGYFCENDAATVLVRDVHRLKKMTQEKLGEQIPYFILGHSMGSIMLRNYLLRYGKGIDGAIIMGTGTVPMPLLAASQLITKSLIAVKGPKHISKKVVSLCFGKYLDHIEQPVTLYDWVNSDEEELDKYVKDPLCTGFTFCVEGFDTLVEMSRRMQLKNLMTRIPQKLPILIASGTEDPVGAWGKDPQELYDTYLNLGLSRVSIKMYPGMRHEILNEKDRDRVFEDIYHWLRQQLTAVSP